MTQELLAWRGGNHEACEQLLPPVYGIICWIRCATMVALGVWTVSYFGDEIDWRGLRFKLRTVRRNRV